MALNVNNPLVGEVLETFLSKAAHGNKIAQHIHIEYAKGRKKLYMPRIKTSKMVQKRVEMPDATNVKGDFNIDTKVLEPKDIMLLTDFNPRSFEGIWRPYQPEGPLVFHDLPAEAKALLLREFQKQAASEFGDLYINADTAYTVTEGTSQVPDNYYSLADGVIKRIVSDADTIVVPTPAALTASNIKGEFERGRKLIPSVLKGHQDLKLFTSIEDAELYDESLTAQQFKGVNYTDKNPERYKGIPIVTLPFLKKDTFFYAVSSTDMDSNIWAAVDYAEDENVIQIDKWSAAGERYFFKMLCKLDTQIGFGEEVVLYKA